MQNKLAKYLLLLVFILAGFWAAGRFQGQSKSVHFFAGADERIRKVGRFFDGADGQPQAYAPASALDPFSSQQLTQALKRDGAPAGAGTALLARELTRRKEALEAVPLDAMALVGTMVRDGQPVALVKSDRLLYQIRPGHHLGQNYGRVVRITETELTLREVVQDATGDWVERTVSLQLQEKSK